MAQEITGTQIREVIDFLEQQISFIADSYQPDEKITLQDFRELVHSQISDMIEEGAVNCGINAPQTQVSSKHAVAALEVLAHSDGLHGLIEKYREAAAEEPVTVNTLKEELGKTLLVAFDDVVKIYGEHADALESLPEIRQ